MPAGAKRLICIASSHASPVSVSIARPSKHHPAFVYDQNGGVCSPVAAVAAKRDSASSSSSNAENENSTCALSGKYFTPTWAPR